MLKEKIEGHVKAVSSGTWDQQLAIERRKDAQRPSSAYRLRITAQVLTVLKPMEGDVVYNLIFTHGKEREG